MKGIGQLQVSKQRNIRNQHRSPEQHGRKVQLTACSMPSKYEKPDLFLRTNLQIFISNSKTGEQVKQRRRHLAGLQSTHTAIIGSTANLLRFRYTTAHPPWHDQQQLSVSLRHLVNATQARALHLSSSLSCSLVPHLNNIFRAVATLAVDHQATVAIATTER